jgi:hypothetical protein
MLLDGYLPEWHHRERHRVPVAATPAAVLAALDEVTWAEAPVFGLLMSMRAGLTGRHRGGRAGRPVLEGFTGIGFAELARDAQEVVFGGIGRPWTPSGGMLTSSDFATFDEPGWAKMAINFRSADGALTSETRAWLTDERSRRLFRRYWLVIRPFSGLTRQSWLGAVRRHAQAAPRLGG